MKLIISFEIYLALYPWKLLGHRQDKTLVFQSSLMAVSVCEARLVFCLTRSSIPAPACGQRQRVRVGQFINTVDFSLRPPLPVMPSISQLSCCTFKVSSFPLVSCDLSYESHDFGSCDQLWRHSHRSSAATDSQMLSLDCTTLHGTFSIQK